MDSIVTARVPAGIKDQGRVALERIGATPTDLINAAYRYVLAKGKLPDAEDQMEGLKPGVRRLDEKQRQSLRESIQRTTFSIPSSYWEGATDEELLQQALKDKYACSD